MGICSKSVVLWSLQAGMLDDALSWKSSFASTFQETYFLWLLLCAAVQYPLTFLLVDIVKSIPPLFQRNVAMTTNWDTVFPEFLGRWKLFAFATHSSAWALDQGVSYRDLQSCLWIVLDLLEIASGIWEMPSWVFSDQHFGHPFW